MNICEVQALIETSLSNIKLVGTQAVMNSGTTQINDGDVVPFNYVVVNQNPAVSLDTTTGVFTVLKGGSYVVNYYVNVNGSDKTTTVVMDCNGIKCEAINAIQGQCSGFACLSLVAGDTIVLKNASSQIILLDGDTTQAGIMIYTL